MFENWFCCCREDAVNPQYMSKLWGNICLNCEGGIRKKSSVSPHWRAEESPAGQGCWLLSSARHVWGPACSTVFSLGLLLSFWSESSRSHQADDGLEHMAYRGRLEEQRLFSLDRGSQRGGMLWSFTMVPFLEMLSALLEKAVSNLFS